MNNKSWQLTFTMLILRNLNKTVALIYCLNCARVRNHHNTVPHDVDSMFYRNFDYYVSIAHMFIMKIHSLCNSETTVKQILVLEL